MPKQTQNANRVKSFRLQRGWSQDHLAKAAGISRASVSAIEIEPLVPSVAAALALALVAVTPFGELSGADVNDLRDESWACLPNRASFRFWRANVRGRVLRIPVEATVAGLLPHDGIVERGIVQLVRNAEPRQTLV